MTDQVCAAPVEWASTGPCSVCGHLDGFHVGEECQACGFLVSGPDDDGFAAVWHAYRGPVLRRCGHAEREHDKLGCNTCADEAVTNWVDWDHSWEPGERCSMCDGSGKEPWRTFTEFFIRSLPRPACEFCRGTGVMPVEGVNA